MVTWAQATASEVFGPYRVYERLGVGGMATVHRAARPSLGGFEHIVALKRLRPEFAVDPATVRFFIREAKLATLLSHANIARVYELGRVAGSYFIAMEYVEGYSLLELLRGANGTHVPIDVSLSILIELCDALDYAHSRTDDLTGAPLGIVHRDVSPSNLIVTHEGNLKVIDFGIAKAELDNLDTEGGNVRGKYGYMAPETLRSRPVDARSDIFSAGVVAHELLTRRRLFGSARTYDTMARLHHARVTRPSDHNPMTPLALDRVVLKALALAPGRRWSSAGAMRDALHEVARAYGCRATSDYAAEWLEQNFGEPEFVIESSDGAPTSALLGDTTAVDIAPLMMTPPITGATPAPGW